MAYPTWMCNWSTGDDRWEITRQETSISDQFSPGHPGNGATTLMALRSSDFLGCTSHRGRDHWWITLMTI